MIITQRTLRVSEFPVARRLLVSALALCLEGLCIGNPKLTAPAPRRNIETGWGATLILVDCIIASIFVLSTCVLTIPGARSRIKQTPNLV